MENSGVMRKDQEEFALAGTMFHRPFFFWFGALAVGIGVCLHFPMFIESADMHYMMVGMKVDSMMLFGMFLVVAGTIATAWGLVPKRERASLAATTRHDVDVHIRAMDDAPLSPAHWTLFAVLLIALIIDIMKPATLGFVVPGMAAEYGMSKQDVAILPFLALIGTMAGSIIWGLVGDAIGRRASMLLAAIMFVGTSICGAMPSFAWNVFMCFMMGIAAGGLLPIAFALLTEAVPNKQRAWLGVLLGGVGTIGGYLAASGCAALLEPHFGWRIMWFLGLPTGLLLVALNRYIPESPRFLAHHGRRDEAVLVLRRFGAIVIADGSAKNKEAAAAVHDISMHRLFRRPYLSLTVGLAFYGLGWGLVNFGFLLWLPAHLRSIGYGVSASDTVLAQSAIIAFPAVVAVAWLCYAWSTKKSMLLSATLTGATLLAFAWFGDRIGAHPVLLMTMLVTLLTASSAVIAILIPYSSEVFPNSLRATGTGLAAGSSKAGGVAALTFAMIATVPTIAAAALIGAIPMALSAWLLYWRGVETRGARLEELERRTHASL